jgi:predicted DNA-binding protein
MSLAMNSKTVITQLRFEPALLEKITEAAQRTGLSKADIMRLAMETGLEDLRRLNFDLPALISQTARPPSKSVNYSSVLKEDDTLRAADLS